MVDNKEDRRFDVSEENPSTPRQWGDEYYKKLQENFAMKSERFRFFQEMEKRSAAM